VAGDRVDSAVAGPGDRRPFEVSAVVEVAGEEVVDGLFELLAEVDLPVASVEIDGMRFGYGQVAEAAAGVSADPYLPTGGTPGNGGCGWW
jgi:hypothetical protein